MDNFDALIYGAPTDNFIQYVNNSMSNMVKSVASKTASGLKKANQYFHKNYLSAEAIDKIKDVYLRAGQTTNMDVISYMEDPSYSGPMMQRYIMAHPDMYQLAKDKNINGFNETLSLGDRPLPEEDHDYLAVMDGWITTDSKNSYPIEYVSTSSALSVGEQLAIIDTWDVCRAIIAEGLDPTEVPERR